MIKWAIFSTRDELDAICLPSSCIIGIPIQSKDGRVAISHSFTDDDLNYLADMGAEVVETLPDDWQYPDQKNDF